MCFSSVFFVFPRRQSPLKNVLKRVTTVSQRVTLARVFPLFLFLWVFIKNILLRHDGFPASDACKSVSSFPFSMCFRCFVVKVLKRVTTVSQRVTLARVFPLFLFLWVFIKNILLRHDGFPASDACKSVSSFPFSMCFRSSWFFVLFCFSARPADFVFCFF